MRILVLSDSHSALQPMRRAIDILKPDAVVHLGDHYDDGTAMEEEFSHIRFHRVPGNCDRYRCPPSARETLCYDVCGVRLLMTHGHNHNVKSSLYLLLGDARRYEAKAALYGHTHVADCHREADGLWVLNPGSCGYGGGTVGLIETEKGEILSCRVLYPKDLDALSVAKTDKM